MALTRDVFNPRAYFQGYHGSGAIWSTASGSFTDPPVSGTPSLTTRISSNITVTQAGSNYPGITFTPSSATAVYKITARILMDTTASCLGQYRLYDGTTEIAVGGGNYINGANGVNSVALIGLYQPGTTSPVTVRIQVAGTSGLTAYIYALGLANAIEWTLEQIAQ